MLRDRSGSRSRSRSLSPSPPRRRTSAREASSRSTPTPTSSQRSRRWRSDADGDFVVVWLSSGPGRRPRTASSPGASRARARPSAGEFQVNTYTLGRSASLRRWRRTADGDFVVVWQSNGQDGSSYGIFARRYSSAGAAARPPSSRSTPTPPTTSSDPSVAMDADGDFVVAWAELRPGRPGYGVFARRFTSAGVAARRASSRSTPTPRARRRYPSVATRRRRRLRRRLGELRPGRRRRRRLRPALRARALALGTEFQVNTYTADDQRAAGGGGGRRRRLRRRLGEQRPGRPDVRRLRPALLERRRAARPASSRSTPTPRATSATRRWRRTPTATSSSPGTASTRTAPTTASSRAASRAPALALGREFQVNTYTIEPAGLPAVAAGRRRRLRRRLGRAAPGRRRLRHLRSALRGASALDVDGDGSACRSPTACSRCATVQLPRRDAMARRAVGGGCSPARRAVDRGLASAAPAASSPGASAAAEFAGHRVPGQRLHARATSSTHSVAADADGDFVVVWTQQRARTARPIGVFARRFTSAGARLATEFQVNDLHPRGAVAARRWRRTPTATSSSPGRAMPKTARTCGIFERRFSSSGTPLG